VQRLEHTLGTAILIQVIVDDCDTHGLSNLASSISYQQTAATSTGSCETDQCWSVNRHLRRIVNRHIVLMARKGFHRPSTNLWEAIGEL
jgi:hypothetical protein